MGIWERCYRSGNSVPNYCTLVSGALEAINEDFDRLSEC
jgi:hypothetical protein